MSSTSNRLRFDAPETLTHKSDEENIDTYQVGNYLGKGGTAKCYKVTNIKTGI